MDFLTLAKKRYSVRAYTKQKVEKEKLDAILEAAHVAPTGGNCQPQHLIVVQSDEGLRKIGKATNIYGAPLAIIVCSDTNKVWTRPFDGKKLTDIDASNHYRPHDDGSHLLRFRKRMGMLFQAGHPEG